ncbi:hypothetical protein BH09GEM1_BH09GEM1_12420 [soil metagenome]
MDSAPDAAASVNPTALQLVERLIERTRGAGESVLRGDVEALHDVLDARDAMLGSLEKIIAMLAANTAPLTARHGVESAMTRIELLAQASVLQRANVQLMRTVRWEAARLETSIAGVKRRDTVGVAYGAAGSASATGLDLVR